MKFSLFVILKLFLHRWAGEFTCGVVNSLCTRTLSLFKVNRVRAMKGYTFVIVQEGTNALKGENTCLFLL